MTQTPQHFDAAIIGSGFAGSILASILSVRGMRVALIDPQTHPRFAVGESSTPIADMLMRKLGDEYALEALTHLSTWGSWQQKYPSLACGRKRGFTYFAHRPDEPFSETVVGERSLWVAASKSDVVADTHWYRPSVDEFLFHLAVRHGAFDLSGFAVCEIEWIPNGDSVIRCDGTHPLTITSEWVIDASGQSGVLAHVFEQASRVKELRTETFASFAHFRNVGSMSEWLGTHGIDSHVPFDSDDAAQHHLVEDGWWWMLRFNHGVTSVGKTGTRPSRFDWSHYPTLCDLMSDAQRVDPPGIVALPHRLQRWFDPIVNNRCMMLPTAAVTLDPLHSTGIAHALAGVDRVARIILEPQHLNRADRLADYRDAIERETRLLDRLLHAAYSTMHDFRRFTLSSMLYFAGAIRCEERYQNGEVPDALWNADDDAFVEVVNWSTNALTGELRGDCPQEDLESEIRDRLQPWNTAGLIDPSVANRYAYTAATKPI